MAVAGVTIKPGVNRVMRNLKRDGTAFIKSVALQAASDFIELTPVDTGVARANWQVGVGVRPAVPDITEDQTSPTTAGPDAIARAAAVIARYRLGLVIFIENRVPYIVILDQGSSSQAPSGMSSIVLARLVAKGVRVTAL